MLQTLFHYYGIDLVATILTLLGLYQLGNKRKIGFVTALIGNVLWMIFSVLSSSAGLLIANIALVVLNIRGYVQWMRQEK